MILDVTYSTLTAVIAANPSAPIYYREDGRTTIIHTGNNNTQFCCRAQGDDRTSFDTDHKPGATAVGADDDALALLVGLAHPADVYSAQGLPTVALSPYASASESTTWEGFRYTAPPNALSIFDETISDSLIYVQGAEEFWVKTPSLGDYIEFSLVDKDDVLGLFATYGLTVGVDVLELKKYQKTWYLPDEFIRRPLLAKTAAAVTGGLYIRAYYYNSHPTDSVELGVNYRWYE